MADPYAEHVKLLEGRIAFLEGHIKNLNALLERTTAEQSRFTLSVVMKTLSLGAWIDHKDAVAIFRLGDKTAKDESKFMEQIRRRFRTGAKRSKRGWQYPLVKVVGIAAALRAAGQSEGENPTPDQIEAAKRAIRAGSLTVHPQIVPQRRIKKAE